MEITKVLIVLAKGSPRDSGKLLARASVEFDKALIIHDIDIVEMPDGKLSIFMPNRQAMAMCECGVRHWIRATYCSGCGVRLANPADPSKFVATTSQTFVPENPRAYITCVNFKDEAARERFRQAVTSAYLARAGGDESAVVSQVGKPRARDQAKPSPVKPVARKHSPSKPSTPKSMSSNPPIRIRRKDGA